MNQDLHLAKSILAAENCTCVLSRGTEVYKSHRRGVAPLMGWLEEGLDLEGFSAADKVVGKATAFLYCLLRVKEVYALVMSQAAANVLEQQGISFQQLTGDLFLDHRPLQKRIREFSAAQTFLICLLIQHRLLAY